MAALNRIILYREVNHKERYYRVSLMLNLKEKYKKGYSKKRVKERNHGDI